MPLIVALVVAVVALAVLGSAIHFLFSPWLLLVAVGIVVWVRLRSRRSRR